MVETIGQEGFRDQFHATRKVGKEPIESSIAFILVVKRPDLGNIGVVKILIG